jgi:hypothetical protein
MKNTITHNTITKKYDSLGSESDKSRFMQMMVYEIVDENYGSKIENFNILKNPNPGYIISGIFQTPRMGGKKLIMGFDISKDKIVLTPKNREVLTYSEQDVVYIASLQIALYLSEKVNYLPLEFFNFAQTQMNCSKGWSCRGPNGYACLAQSKKNCNVQLDTVHKTYSGWLADKISSGTKLHNTLSFIANRAKSTPTATSTAAPAAKSTPTAATPTKNPYQDIADAIKNGDIDSLGTFAEKLEKETDSFVNTHNNNPKNTKLSSLNDNTASTLAEKLGFNAKPKIGNVDDVDNIAKNGGNLSFRAMGEQIYFDFFKNGNNFLSTGEKDNNLYGTGIYVLTVFDTPVTAQKAEDAHKILTKRGYSNPGYPAKKSATARMATSADFKWGDQEKNSQDVAKLESDLKTWLAQKENDAKAKYPAPIQLFSSLSEQQLRASTNSSKFSSARSAVSTKLNNNLTETPKKTKIQPSSLGNDQFEIEMTFKESKAQKSISVSIDKMPYDIAPPKFTIEKVENDKYEYIKRDGTKVVDSYEGIVVQAKADHAYKEGVRIFNSYLKDTSSPGGSNAVVSPQAQKLITEARETYKKVADVFIGDINKAKTSGRLAIIQGYDGMRLNKSYEPNN